MSRASLKGLTSHTLADRAYRAIQDARGGLGDLLAGGTTPASTARR